MPMSCPARRNLSSSPARGETRGRRRRKKKEGGRSKAIKVATMGAHPGFAVGGVATAIARQRLFDPILDRQGRALPQPDHARPDLAAGFVAPSTPIEELVAAAWAAVLGRDEVGVDDNFYDLGGDSLLATKVVARLREFEDIELPLRCMFETPTVAQLARRIVEDLAGESGAEDLLAELEA